MQARELLRRISLKESLVVIDVRSGFEFNSGHIPGAVHAPAWKILLKMAKLPQDKACELVVTCEHGPRAQLAHGLLAMYGYKNVTLLDGHMSAWRQAGLKMER